MLSLVTKHSRRCAVDAAEGFILFGGGAPDGERHVFAVVVAGEMLAFRVEVLERVVGEFEDLFHLVIGEVALGAKLDLGVVEGAVCLAVVIEVDVLEFDLQIVLADEVGVVGLVQEDLDVFVVEIAVCVGGLVAVDVVCLDLVNEAVFLVLHCVDFSVAGLVWDGLHVELLAGAAPVGRPVLGVVVEGAVGLVAFVVKELPEVAGSSG